MSTKEERKERRNKGARIGVAALAVLGVGAAITTAAWTDEVWFEAGVDVGNAIALEGRATESSNWVAAGTDGEAIEFTIPMKDLGALVPNEVYTATVHVRNVGTVEAKLTAAATWGTAGGEWPESTITLDAEFVDPVLSKGQETEVNITVKTGDIPASFMGAKEAVLVQVTGEAP